MINAISISETAGTLSITGAESYMEAIKELTDVLASGHPLGTLKDFTFGQLVNCPEGRDIHILCKVYLHVTGAIMSSNVNITPAEYWTDLLFQARFSGANMSYIIGALLRDDPTYDFMKSYETLMKDLDNPYFLLSEEYFSDELWEKLMGWSNLGFTNPLEGVRSTVISSKLCLIMDDLSSQYFLNHEDFRVIRGDKVIGVGPSSLTYETAKTLANKPISNLSLLLKGP